LNHGHEICAIISPDASVKRWAAGKDVPHLDPAHDPAALVSQLSRQSFDYLFSIVNFHILPEEVLQLPRRGAINYHDSPLPRYAGTQVTSWALMNRETTHGVTWHLMSKQVDAGDILKQRSVNIADNDTAFTLNTKCYDAAIHSFAELVDDLASGQVSPIKQNLEERTFFSYYKRPPAGCVLSLNGRAADIDASFGLWILEPPILTRSVCQSSPSATISLSSRRSPFSIRNRPPLPERLPPLTTPLSQCPQPITTSRCAAC
jgi:methionyl-tRNA formyltransferase